MIIDLIEEHITQYPIYQYVFLDAAQIEFSDKVRTICKKECPRYGNSWSCPPAVGSVAECKEKCLKYPKVLLFSSVAEVPDYSDMEHTLKTKREHEALTRKVEKFLRINGIPNYILSTDSCSFCDKCTYPRKTCLHPEMMHPCIESHGIILTNTIEQNNMDFFLGEQFVLWFSMVFFSEEEEF